MGQWLHQWFKFFLSLSSPVFHGLTLRSRQLSLWISSVVPWRLDKFHEKKRDDFIQSPFSKSWRGGEADIFSQKPPEFLSMSLLSRLAHALILEYWQARGDNHSFPKKHMVIWKTLDSWTKWMFCKSGMIIFWVDTILNMRQRKKIGDKLQTVQFDALTSNVCKVCKSSNMSCGRVTWPPYGRGPYSKPPSALLPFILPHFFGCYIAVTYLFVLIYVSSHQLDLEPLKLRALLSLSLPSPS